MDEASLAARVKDKPFFDVLLDARKQYGGKFRIFCDHGQRPITYNGFITRVLLIEDVLKNADMEGDNIGCFCRPPRRGSNNVLAPENGKDTGNAEFFAWRTLIGELLQDCMRKDGSYFTKVY